MLHQLQSQHRSTARCWLLLHSTSSYYYLRLSFSFLLHLFSFIDLLFKLLILFGHQGTTNIQYTTFDRSNCISYKLEVCLLLSAFSSLWTSFCHLGLPVHRSRARLRSHRGPDLFTLLNLPHYFDQK